MTTRLLLAIARVCTCSSYSGVDGQYVNRESANDTVPVFSKQGVPSSQRSRNTTARMAPSLIGNLQSRGLSYGAPVFMHLFKKERELELWVQKDRVYELFQTYDIVAMSGHLVPKLREGDQQAPEGFYFVPPSRMNPNSRLYLSFNLSYPNSYDRAHNETGSALMVHGNRISIGCFAMTDSSMEDIYCLADASLRNGQEFFRVHCFPFRMTTENMEAHGTSDGLPFWKNLKTGYGWFEETRRPPTVFVRNREYVFEEADS